MRKTVWWTAGLLIMVTMVISLGLVFLDEPLRAYAEREMNRHLEGYTITIGRMDFHPIGLSLDLENVKLFQNEHPDPPIAEIPQWHASIHWRAVLHGHLVSDHLMDRPVAHVTLT